MNLLSYQLNSELKMLNVEDVAKKINVSKRKVELMKDSGSMPKPVNFGKSIRWNSLELDCWLACGAPDVAKTGWTMAAALDGK